MSEDDNLAVRLHRAARVLTAEESKERERIAWLKASNARALARLKEDEARFAAKIEQAIAEAEQARRPWWARFALWI